MEVKQHVLLDRPYQGDGIWIFLWSFHFFSFFASFWQCGENEPPVSH
jgi:hypothetical protein